MKKGEITGEEGGCGYFFVVVKYKPPIYELMTLRAWYFESYTAD